MTRLVALAVLAIAVASCSNQTEIGARYRAEREFWKANSEYRQLSIRPELATDEQWRAIAARYETLAERYGPAITETSASEETAVRELRILVARALTSAARVHTVRGDTTRMLRLYEEVEAQFADIPDIAMEVYFSRARVAESQGNLAEAADLYDRVLENTGPMPDHPSVQGAVLELPLRIARIRRKLNPGSPQAHAAYRAARERYEGWIAEQPNTLVAYDARSRLADIASDQGDIDEAVRLLRSLESDLNEAKVKARNPAGIRFATAVVQSQNEATQDSTRATLRSLIEDYPTSAFAPQALLSLATEAGKRDADEALGYLDELMRDYATLSPQASARALVLRAHILEQHNRWHEALAAYRQLGVEHPFSQEALNAPLEIVNHYQRTGETEERTAALASAENAYNDFLADNPPGPLTFQARRLLYQTWALQDRVDEAIAGLEDLGAETTGTREGALVLIDAARMAAAHGDSAKATEIVERIKSLYGGSRVDSATDDSASSPGANSR